MSQSTARCLNQKTFFHFIVIVSSHTKFLPFPRDWWTNVWLRSDHKGCAFFLDEKKSGEGKGVNREENYLVRRREGQGRAGKSEKENFMMDAQTHCEERPRILNSKIAISVLLTKLPTTYYTFPAHPIPSVHPSTKPLWYLIINKAGHGLTWVDLQWPPMTYSI